MVELDIPDGRDAGMHLSSRLRSRREARQAEHARAGDGRSQGRLVRPADRRTRHVDQVVDGRVQIELLDDGGIVHLGPQEQHVALHRVVVDP